MSGIHLNEYQWLMKVDIKTNLWYNRELLIGKAIMLNKKLHDARDITIGVNLSLRIDLFFNNVITMSAFKVVPHIDIKSVRMNPNLLKSSE